MWVKSIAMLCLACFCATATSIASAADPPPSPAASATPSAAMAAAIELARSRIDSMLRTGHADAAWFSASFLAQIPASMVDTVIANLEGQLGAYRLLDFVYPKFIAHFAKGSDEVDIHLDADSKIDGLLFRPPMPATN